MRASLPTQSSSMTLTSDQLEHWFATIERDNEPNTTETDSYLSTQFLSRFGLKDASEVLKFLKTAAGNETINMIAQEIMKEEAHIQHRREQNLEEMLQQQRMLFLLMKLIAKERSEEKEQQNREIAQEQIDKKLKESKTEGKKDQPIDLHIMDATILANKILEVDKELIELNKDLAEVENELDAIEEEVLLMQQTHAHMTDHMDQLNAFLQAPLFNNQPMQQYVAHTNQQITSLTTQLTDLKTQYSQIPTPSDPRDVASVQETKSHIERKIRMVEDQLSFHQDQLKQPPQTSEEAVQRRLEQVRTQQKSVGQETQSPTHNEREMEGLRLQERGLLQAQQVLRKEKVLYNSAGEQVNNFDQAHFIMDPNERALFRKHGDSYLVLSKDMNPENLSDQDLTQAKQNFNNLKYDISTVNSFYNDRRQEQLETLGQRAQNCQSRVQNLLDSINKLQTNKVQLLQGKTPPSMTPSMSPSMTPKPQPKSSYSLMLQRLVPSHAPAPSPEDISKAHNVLEEAVSPNMKGVLNELINEVKPGEIMPPETRYNWFNRFKKLMPDIPIPEESESRLKHDKL